MLIKTSFINNARIIESSENDDFSLFQLQNMMQTTVSNVSNQCEFQKVGQHKMMSSKTVVEILQFCRNKEICGT